MAPPPPGERVIAAFGLEGPAERLPGGRGTSWRAGGGVLKPFDTSLVELAWQAKVLGAIWPDGIRIAYPLRTFDGKLVVDGWTASTWLEGEHQPRWREVVAAGRRFHGALADVRRPAFLDRHTDAWSTGDRVAWDELPVDPYARLPAIRELADRRRPIPDAVGQLIHGDLTGNVLFSPTEPPAIIDFAPYWRPVGFASAVVVADALAWEGADGSILDLLRDAESPDQYLIRAALYRMVTDVIAGDEARLSGADGGAYWPVLEAIRSLGAGALPSGER